MSAAKTVNRAAGQITEFGTQVQQERAESLIRTVCELAGSMSFIDEIKAEVRDAGLIEAVARGDTPPIFDWLLTTFSYQGVSDQAARTYMARHGAATWSGVAKSLRRPCSCPRLRNYWQYEGCRYDKSSVTCAEPEHIQACPVPRPLLRNGRLNQTAYSLFLFVRDVAGSNLVAWIDSQLAAAASSPERDLEAAQQEALIGPLRHVYGVSDKVLTMALSVLLIGTGEARPRWSETGAGMLAIDTLVHNFLQRTGILGTCGTPHSYGAACYRRGGCAEVVRNVAGRIDASKFNPRYPAIFPRFVQHAIWRYCAADGLNICNGNQIDDRRGCRNAYCRLGQNCARNRLNH
jgi:hypothetical protein